MGQDTPETGIVFLQETAGGQDRHVLGEGHDDLLQEQGEAAVNPGPRDRHDLDPTTGAVDAGGAHMQISEVLEEVEVTPGPLLTVVSGATRLFALGAREAASLGKGDVDVQPLAGPVEGATVDLPGGLQKEGLLQQLGVLHRFRSSLLFGDTRHAAAGCLVFYPAGGKEWTQDMLPQAV